MAVVVNTKKARLDKDGNFQRPKVKGYLPISLGYGIYLGDSFDERSGIFKAFFLMLSSDASGNISHPKHFMASPLFAGVSLEEFPFSKKFSAADGLVEALVPGSDYWFAYTSEATTSVIDAKPITYEALNLIAADDVPGMKGLEGILDFLNLIPLPV